jgi:hypothetical protein
MSYANPVLLGCSGPRVFLPLNETHLCINPTTGNTKGLCAFMDNNLHTVLSQVWPGAWPLRFCMVYSYSLPLRELLTFLLSCVMFRV